MLRCFEIVLARNIVQSLFTPGFFTRDCTFSHHPRLSLYQIICRHTSVELRTVQDISNLFARTRLFVSRHRSLFQLLLPFPLLYTLIRQTLHLLQTPNLQLANPQHRIPMLALHQPPMPIPLLLLLYDAQRLALRPNYRCPTYKQPIIQIPLLKISPIVFRGCGGAERVVSAAEYGGSVQAQDVARLDAVDEVWEA